MSRKGKHDIAPLVRAAFVRGFEKYCRKKGMTYSDAMQALIEEQGLGYVLDRVSRFTVRENTVQGKIEHEHRRQPTDLELAQELAAILTSGQESSDSETGGVQTLVAALTGPADGSTTH